MAGGAEAMMGILLWGAAAAIGIAAAFSYRTAKGARRKGAMRLPNAQPPAALGIQADHPAYGAAVRLEAALDADFTARLEARVRGRSPGMTQAEWEWTWFELKRYFLMCGIMRQVQMYGARTDDIWHEMLVFTREYQHFCERFCGTMIHHAPHGQASRPCEDDRAWFDWVYSELYEPSPVTEQVWGRFFVSPMSRTMLEEPLVKTPNAYREARFNMRAADRNAELAYVVEWLAGCFGQQLTEGRRHVEGGRTYPKRSRWDEDSFACAGGAIVYASMLAPGDYERNMEGLLERGKSGGDSTGSGCSSSGGVHSGKSDGSGSHGDSSPSDSGGGGGDGGASCGSAGCGSS
jgi:hypothetical protein